MFPIPHVNLPYNLVLIPMFRVSNIPLDLIPFTFYTFIEVRTIKRMDIYGLITNTTNCGLTLQKTTCEVTRMKILISLSYLIFLMQMPLIVILPFQLSLNNLYAKGLASLKISTASSVRNVASVSSSFFFMVSKGGELWYAWWFGLFKVLSFLDNWLLAFQIIFVHFFSSYKYIYNKNFQ